MANCPKCNITFEVGQRFCTFCGSPLPAAANTQARRARTRELVGAAGLVALLLAGSLIDKSESKATDSQKEEQHWFQDCDSVANQYMEDQKQGNSQSVVFLWDPLKLEHVTTLFDVRDFKEITSGPYGSNGFQYTMFDVRSSTEGGFPIRKRWDVVLKPSTTGSLGKDECVIEDVEDGE